MSAPLLQVHDLNLRFATDEGLVTAVESASFELEAGEILGLVGESGSGKSVTAKSLMHLNTNNARYGEQGYITLNLASGPVDVLGLKRERDMRVVRGGAISMIFQEPMASFAPALTIGQQMVEQLLVHTDNTAKQARSLAIEMLARVGIADADKRIDQYAFQLSGGMRQRAMIAMALSTSPKLLIADEPTTALDVTIQAQVIDLMKDLVSEFGMAILFITHDLGVIAQTADKVAVMYLGRIVETGPVRDVLKNPLHPYTRGLLRALPRLDALDEPLQPVPGDIPSPLERPSGCVFHTRCGLVQNGRCDTAIPQVVAASNAHSVACHVVADALDARA
jgi:peptide/nickel transport system ATP-binding protein